MLLANSAAEDKCLIVFLIFFFRIFSAFLAFELSPQRKIRTTGPRWPCSCIAHLSIIVLREPDLEMIKANILTKIHYDYINNQDNAKWTVKYMSRSNMDDCTQEVMLRCMHVPSITGCRAKSY